MLFGLSTNIPLPCNMHTYLLYDINFNSPELDARVAEALDLPSTGEITSNQCSYPMQGELEISLMFGSKHLTQMNGKPCQEIGVPTGRVYVISMARACPLEFKAATDKSARLLTWRLLIGSLASPSRAMFNSKSFFLFGFGLHSTDVALPINISCMVSNVIFSVLFSSCTWLNPTCQAKYYVSRKAWTKI